MSRYSTSPTTFQTFGELERGFLHQIRRFRRACAEVSAPIILSGKGPGPGVPGGSGGPPENSPDHRQLDLLKSQEVLLKNMSAQILVNFPGERQAEVLRKRIDDLCNTIHERSETLRRDLGAQARKIVARSVVVRNHQVMDMLKEDLGKRVQNVNETYLVGPVILPGVPDRRPITADVAYVRLSDVRGIDGFTHPQYFVMTAHPRAEGNDRVAPMYVAVSPDFRTPSRIRWQAAVKNPSQMRKLVLDLLTADGVVGSSEKRSIPLPADQVKFVHDNIAKTTVSGDQIVVRVKNKRKLEETREALRSQLNGIVHAIDPKNRDVIRDKVDASKGVIYFIFSLPGKLRGTLIDNSLLNRIRQLLNVDDATLQRIKSAIEDPE